MRKLLSVLSIYALVSLSFAQAASLKNTARQFFYSGYQKFTKAQEKENFKYFDHNREPIKNVHNPFSIATEEGGVDLFTVDEESDYAWRVQITPSLEKPGTFQGNFEFYTKDLKTLKGASSFAFAKGAEEGDHIEGYLKAVRDARFQADNNLLGQVFSLIIPQAHASFDASALIGTLGIVAAGMGIILVITSQNPNARKIPIWVPIALFVGGAAAYIFGIREQDKQREEFLRPFQEAEAD